MTRIRPRPGRAAMLALSLVSAGCDLGYETDGEAVGSDVSRSQIEVFSSVRREAPDGAVVDSEVRGELSPEVAERVGRPWTHFDEAFLYDEEAWATSGPDGGVEHGYRVWRAANRTPVRRSIESGPPRFEAQLLELAGRRPADEPIQIVLRLRNFPQWDLPLRALGFALSAQDLLDRAEQRELRLRERAELVRDLFADVAAQVRGAGGRVLGRSRYSNWLAAELPAGRIAELQSRPDVMSVAPFDGELLQHSVPIGELRQADRLDADRFHAAGYTGERANPTRHAHNDIVVGVIEPGLLEDEACFLYDGSTCSGNKRLIRSVRCDDADGDGNYCEPVTSFDDDDSNAGHGTVVSSVILADYRQGQGDAYQLGDSNWTAGSGHSNTWKNRATGMAPEASLIFFGQMGSGGAAALGFADAFDDSVDYAVDLTNSSWAFDSAAGICSRGTSQPFDEELEDAFDDGILNVVAAGNPNSPGDTSVQCNLFSPADVPKSLTVNAVNAGDNACAADYNDCLLDTNYSAMGGIDAEYSGQIYAGTVTGVDLVAPNYIRDITWPTGAYGSVGGTFVGTSAASPVVAGSAALVKDWQLAQGHTWINYPGRLHTMMLAMTDRYRGDWKATDPGPSVWGSHPLWGLGKLKLRLFQNGQGIAAWGYHMRTTSFTASSSDFTYQPFGEPIPTNAALVKCVLMQDEDMSDKDDISKVDLVMRLRRPVNGSCSASGDVTYTRADRRVDIKKMGAITGGAVRDRCLYVTLDTRHITSQGITTHVMCSYSSEMDDE